MLLETRTFVSSPLMLISVSIFEVIWVLPLAKLVEPLPDMFSLRLAVFVSGSRIFHSPLPPFRFRTPLFEIVSVTSRPLTFVVKVPPFSIFKAFWSIAFATTLAPFLIFVTPCPPNVPSP